MFDDFEEELDVISESESSSEDSDVQIDKERQSIGRVKNLIFEINSKNW